MSDVCCVVVGVTFPHGVVGFRVTRARGGRRWRCGADLRRCGTKRVVLRRRGRCFQLACATRRVSAGHRGRDEGWARRHHAPEGALRSKSDPSRGIEAAVLKPLGEVASPRCERPRIAHETVPIRPPLAKAPQSRCSAGRGAGAPNAMPALWTSPPRHSHARQRQRATPRASWHRNGPNRPRIRPAHTHPEDPSPTGRKNHQTLRTAFKNPRTIYLGRRWKLDESSLHKMKLRSSSY